MIKNWLCVDLHCHMQCCGITLVTDGAVCVQLMGLAQNIDDCSSRHNESLG